jgi:hypothetical protein
VPNTEAFANLPKLGRNLALTTGGRPKQRINTPRRSAWTASWLFGVDVALSDGSHLEIIIKNKRWGGMVREQQAEKKGRGKGR